MWFPCIWVNSRLKTWGGPLASCRSSSSLLESSVHKFLALDTYWATAQVQTVMLDSQFTNQRALNQAVMQQYVFAHHGNLICFCSSFERWQEEQLNTLPLGGSRCQLKTKKKKKIPQKNKTCYKRFLCLSSISATCIYLQFKIYAMIENWSNDSDIHHCSVELVSSVWSVSVQVGPSCWGWLLFLPPLSWFCCPSALRAPGTCSSRGKTRRQQGKVGTCQNQPLYIRSGLELISHWRHLQTDTVSFQVWCKSPHYFQDDVY